MVFATAGDSLPECRQYVEDFCSLDPYMVDDDTPAATVLEEMAKRHIGSVIILSQGCLAGIFTVTDACALLARLLKNSAA